MSQEATLRGLALLILGRSAGIAAVREKILRVAPMSAAVLIEGESGTGKELVAEAIHLASGRPGKLVAINVCAIAESMFEASLFGHVRGAFTGAVGESVGFIGEAARGTLFLDEIGGLPISQQAKLLRVLETKTYRRIGNRSDDRCDFRVIAATNVPLRELVALGAFRTDLFERLRAVGMTLPPLRERRDDIPMLAQAFLDDVANGRTRSFTAAALNLLTSFAWPTNVRQLRNVVQLAAVMCDEAEIDSPAIARILSDIDPLIAPSRRRDAARQIRLSAVVRETLVVLDEERGDVDRAASRLGVHRATVYRRIRVAGRPRT